MNASQLSYYRQALSDLEVFDFLRGNRPCHRLHYLQMLTEKLAKAYYYGKKLPVAKSHKGFGRFIRGLAAEQPKIWKKMKFVRLEDFENYLTEINHLALEIERLAPSEAGNGPNPEYPWPPPPDPPIHCPAEHSFPLWHELEYTAKGRKFMGFVRTIIRLFPQRF